MSPPTKPARGYALIARVALEHPTRLPRDVLADVFDREKTIAGVARALGTERVYARTALQAFGLLEASKVAPAMSEATRAGLAAKRKAIAEVQLCGPCAAKKPGAGGRIALCAVCQERVRETLARPWAFLPEVARIPAGAGD
jgi:hypothetical protein